jgi:hypothetical protein
MELSIIESKFSQNASINADARVIRENCSEVFSKILGFIELEESPEYY